MIIKLKTYCKKYILYNIKYNYFNHLSKYMIISYNPKLQNICILPFSNYYISDKSR